MILRTTASTTKQQLFRFVVRWASSDEGPVQGLAGADVFYEMEGEDFLKDFSRQERKSSRLESSKDLKASTPIPPPEPLPPSVMPTIHSESEVDKEIRAHNSSIYDLKGQVIIGKVAAVGQKEVLVDLGWKDYQPFFKKELSMSQVYRKDTVSGTRALEGTKKDFRPGDELRFRIEELGTPHGEIFVSTQKMRADIRKRLVWEELVAAFRKEQLVTGRVLNPINSGYAVGIAGFVAFCPLNRITPTVARRIGVLQPFHILMISKEVGANLVVADVQTRFVARPLNQSRFM